MSAIDIAESEDSNLILWDVCPFGRVLPPCFPVLPVVEDLFSLFFLRPSPWVSVISVVRIGFLAAAIGPI